MLEHGFTSHMRVPGGFFVVMDRASLIHQYNHKLVQEAMEKAQVLDTNDYKVPHQRFYPFQENRAY
ncbi:hypothetical protein PMIN06_000169 [Paraphaeosphaeria minitans]